MYVLLIIAIYSDSCVEKTLIYYPHITKKCDICDMIQIETIFDILVKGFIIGVVVSAPLGPVGVLCIQRTLNKGRWYGFVTGLGASLSDIAYALLTGYGMSFVFDYINKNIFYLQLLGSIMLLLFGIYTFRSNPVQSIRPASSSKGSYFHNFITAFFVTLSNLSVYRTFRPFCLCAAGGSGVRRDYRICCYCYRGIDLVVGDYLLCEQSAH